MKKKLHYLFSLNITPSQMLAQRPLKMPSETDKICLHKVPNPLLCNVAKRPDTLGKPSNICCKIYKVCPTIIQHCKARG